jgi:hypothetical protein
VGIITSPVQFNAHVQFIIRFEQGFVSFFNRREFDAQLVKPTGRTPDFVLKMRRGHLTEFGHMPGAGQEIRSPSKIAHHIKIRVSPEGEGLNRTGRMTGLGTFRAHTEVVVFHKYLSPSHDMDAMGAYLNAFPTGDAISGPVEPVFSYGVSEPGCGSHRLR